MTENIPLIFRGVKSVFNIPLIKAMSFLKFWQRLCVLKLSGARNKQADHPSLVLADMNIPRSGHALILAHSRVFWRCASRPAPVRCLRGYEARDMPPDLICLSLSCEPHLAPFTLELRARRRVRASCCWGREMRAHLVCGWGETPALFVSQVTVTHKWVFTRDVIKLSRFYRGTGENNVIKSSIIRSITKQRPPH